MPSPRPVRSRCPLYECRKTKVPEGHPQGRVYSRCSGRRRRNGEFAVCGRKTGDWTPALPIRSRRFYKSSGRIRHKWLYVNSLRPFRGPPTPRLLLSSEFCPSLTRRGSQTILPTSYRAPTSRTRVNRVYTRSLHSSSRATRGLRLTIRTAGILLWSEAKGPGPVPPRPP
jgi:hypothetical protein